MAWTRWRSSATGAAPSTRWPVGRRLPVRMALRSRSSTGSMAELGGQPVHLGLVGEAGLDGSEPAHGPARRVVGVDDVAVDGGAGHVVGADREAGGVGADGGRAGGVGAAVEHDPRLHVDQPAVAPGAVLVGEAGRMAVDVAEERLLARVEDLDRTAGAQGQHAGVDLHGQVLAGAEGAADAGQGDPDLLRRQVEAGGELVAVDVQPLGGDVQVDPALAVGHGQAGLGAEEGLVLHADLVLAGDHDGGGCLLVAVADADVAQDVAVGVERGSAVGHGGLGVDQRVELLVVDRDQGGGPAGGLGVVGGDQGDGLALVADVLPGQDRLVGDLQAVGLAAGHVLVGEDGQDPGHGQGLGRLDRADPGPRVGAADGRAPQHPLGPQVRGVGELSLHLERPVGPARALADPAGDRHGRGERLPRGRHRCRHVEPPGNPPTPPPPPRPAARRTASRTFS